MDKLYAPGMLGRMKLKNHWIMLAMHTGYADEKGNFSDRDFAFYRERAGGGAAAITLVGGVSMIGCQEAMHRLDSDIYNEGIQKISSIIHEEDCRVIMQLFHSGRNCTAQCHDGMLPICPSPVASPIYRTVPREMTEDDIQETIDAFADAAVRCRDNGIDGVEISASAGYLLSQFMSPLVNQRTDEWGGTRDKRMRFPTEVLKAVRRAVGKEFTVLIKISGGDMMGGYEAEEMIDFVNQLPAGTIDGVTVTGGWHEAPVPQITYHVAPGGFAYLAEAVKKGTGLPVIACNRINSREAADEILERGIVDFVGTARSFLADPHFAEKARLNVPYNKCQGCNRGCIERILRGQDVRCAFNPAAGREYLGQASKRFENVLVVGAGPVGLETAKLLLETGAHVTVITKEKKIGGKLAIAAAPPKKQDMITFGETLVYEIERMGGKILAEMPVSSDIIEEIRPDYIYFATGARPVRMYIPGEENSGIDIIAADDVLAGKLPDAGSRILIAGGGTVGLETAEFLAARNAGYDITVLEMAPKAGKDLGGLKWIVMSHLKEQGVRVITSSTVAGACRGEILADEKNEDGQQTVRRVSYPCDTVIMAVGAEPEGTAGMEEYLEIHGIPYCVIGDGRKSRNIMDGLDEAFWAVRGEI